MYKDCIRPVSKIQETLIPTLAIVFFHPFVHLVPFNGRNSCSPLMAFLTSAVVLASPNGSMQGSCRASDRRICCSPLRF